MILGRKTVGKNQIIERIMGRAAINGMKLNQKEHQIRYRPAMSLIMQQPISRRSMTQASAQTDCAVVLSQMTLMLKKFPIQRLAPMTQRPTTNSFHSRISSMRTLIMIIRSSVKCRGCLRMAFPMIRTSQKINKASTILTKKRAKMAVLVLLKTATCISPVCPAALQKT